MSTPPMTSRSVCCKSRRQKQQCRSYNFLSIVARMLQSFYTGETAIQLASHQKKKDEKEGLGGGRSWVVQPLRSRSHLSHCVIYQQGRQGSEFSCNKAQSCCVQHLAYHWYYSWEERRGPAVRILYGHRFNRLPRSIRRSVPFREATRYPNDQQTAVFSGSSLLQLSQRQNLQPYR